MKPCVPRLLLAYTSGRPQTAIHSHRNMHLDCIRQGIKVKATPSRCTAWVKPGHSADDVLAKLPPSVRREVKLDWDTKAGLVGLSGTFNDESRSMLRNFPEIASVEEEDVPYPQRIDRTDSDQPYES